MLLSKSEDADGEVISEGDLQWTLGSGPTQIHTPAHSHCPPIQPGHGQGSSGHGRGAPVLPKVLTAQLWAPLLLESLLSHFLPWDWTQGSTHLPALGSTLCAGECQSGWAPVIGTGSLGPISPQRGHYHVIWSGSDTVCMESRGRLQGGADLTPSVPHPHPCLGTSDDSWIIEKVHKGSWAEGRESSLCSLWENPSLQWKS